MSDVFFQDLGLPAPDLHLGVGSGSHAEQSGQVMMAYEKVLFESRPDMVIVVGDVNSTMACTIAAVKISYKSAESKSRSSNSDVVLNSTDLDRPLVAHLEAGLRSYDRRMPEEVNRLVTDTLADILWPPSPDADDNLIREGVDREKIQRVGNIMIDSLEMLRNSIQKQSIYRELGLNPGEFGLVTLHRPSNVDDPRIMKRLCHAIVRISQRVPLVFPVHPRTRKRMVSLGLLPLLEKEDNLKLSEPISYIRFMNLIFNCRFALTDSGGLQEETTYLGIPCLTLRPNTERPITILEGSNRLCDLDDFEEHVDELLSKKFFYDCKIDLWDGRTADRVVASIKSYLKSPAK